MLSYKTYTYHRHTSYYLTYCGIQFGGVMFSLKEVNERIEELKQYGK